MVYRYQMSKEENIHLGTAGGKFLVLFWTQKYYHWVTFLALFWLVSGSLQVSSHHHYLHLVKQVLI